MASTVSTASIESRREAALRFLYERIDYERALAVPYDTQDFKLERMRELLHRLGNPQQGMPIVHVAGTKGKGSTTMMVATVLTAAGYRAGAFTSPHLHCMEERLAVDGQSCSAEELVELIEQVTPVVLEMDRLAAAACPEETGPTYFEITTALALLHFARHGVDAAVLEVGMGGRLDSTNVCQPRVAVITSISFDHMRQLGNTLAAIAREKAGIIKPGVPVVSGVVDEEPREVIRQTCRELGCRLAELGIDFDYRYDPPRGLEETASPGRLDFAYPAPDGPLELRDLSLSLVGRHQAANAAVAIATLAELRRAGWNIPEQAIREGLARVVWPARAEVVARRPVIVVDAAHNLASIDALVHVLDESFTVRRRLLVFATTQEKDLRGMLGRILGRFDHVVFTRYWNNPRGVPPEELDDLAEQLTGRRCQVCSRPSEAWDVVRSMAAPDDLICITGSFFIAAEMRLQIGARPFTMDGSPTHA
ncbi:MAG: bifunctional folylpolyglutamate synthase/dihydrofolate synthase [Pirellulales bacterium]|nr:bifunctional folylpolyglutamate synthase/dihydrofolate synthase [Pirellulales bacterium]